MIPIAKPMIGKEEIDAVTIVLKSGMLAQGETVKQFEDAFAKYTGVPYAIAVNSGTAALHACLEALRMNEGEEVLVPTFTFGASINAILMAGARPVLVDIDEKTFNMDLSQIEEKLSTATNAIMPVHLFGQMVNPKELQAMASDYKLNIVEDAAQAHGAEFDGAKAGSFGIANAFSFYATKAITSSEGGIITTRSQDIAEFIQSFRHHGQDRQYNYVRLGHNYRMTNIAAAIAIEQLKKLDERNDIRIKNAEFYDKKLKNISGITIPFKHEKAKHAYHQYSVLVDKENYGLSRDELENHLKDNGIGCSVFYPKPMHLQPYHGQLLQTSEGDFPIAEKIARQILSIPVHPSLKKEELEYIAEKIKR